MNLALNRTILSLFRGRHVGGCQAYCYVCLMGASIYPPVWLYTPHTSVCSCIFVYPLYIHISPYIPVCSPYVTGTWGGISTTHMAWDFGGHWYISHTFLGLSVHSFVPQVITVIPVAPHHCGSLLKWTGCLCMYVTLHAVDLLFSL